MHQNPFFTTPDGQKYLFWKKFLVVWKYVQVHQNTSLTTPGGKKYLFWKKFLVFSKYAQMHQNTFLNTPDGQKNLFWRNDSVGLEICANASKHVFKHSRRSKISFLKKKFLVVWKHVQMHQNMFLVVFKHVQMHQNTFLTTPDGKKYLFWKKVTGGLEACAHASKHDFNHSRR